MIDYDLIARAAKFAKDAHGSIDQRRKYTNEPYIVHPESVAATIYSITYDPIMTAAAWLHDVVEDTNVTIDEVQQEFGDEVAKLVGDLTKVTKPGDGSRAFRKSVERNRLAQADSRAKTIKLADIIDNIHSIVEYDAKFAKVYVIENELLLKVLKDGDSGLFNHACSLIKSAKRRLGL